MPIDLPDQAENLRRLKALAEETGAKLMFLHDMESFNSYTPAPGYYS